MNKTEPQRYIWPSPCEKVDGPSSDIWEDFMPAERTLIRSVSWLRFVILVQELGDTDTCLLCTRFPR